MKVNIQQKRKVLRAQSCFIESMPEEYELEIRGFNRFVFIYKDVVLCYKINLSEKLEIDDYNFSKELPNKNLISGFTYNHIIVELTNRLVISQLNQADINFTKTSILSTEFEYSKKVLTSLGWLIKEKTTKLGNGKNVITNYIFYKSDLNSTIDFYAIGSQYIMTVKF